jgi:hypothetical protein
MVRNVREENRNQRDSVNRVIHEEQGHNGAEGEDEQPDGQSQSAPHDSAEDDSPDAIVDVSTDYLASEEAQARGHDGALITDPAYDNVKESQAAPDAAETAPERHVNIEV